MILSVEGSEVTGKQVQDRKGKFSDGTYMPLVAMNVSRHSSVLRCPLKHISFFNLNILYYFPTFKTLHDMFSKG